MVPKLRFKEFCGEWEEKRLGEIMYSFDYGMNSAAIEFDGKNKYIRITDIDENSHKYINKNIVSPSGELEDKYIVRENDILFARTGASTGKTYLYNEDDGSLYFAGFLIRGNVKKEYNSYFVFSQTLTDKYNKWVALTSIRSGQPGINSNEYSGYKIKVPSLSEQSKIADFLSTVDDKIQNQQDKITHLENIKKGFMQKIFSRKIRFKDDSGEDFPEWEEKKIKDVFKITRGYVLSANNVEKNINKEYIYPVYSSQTKDKGLLGYYNEYLYEDAITWTTDGANAGTVHFRRGKFYCTNVCGVLISENGYANKCIAEMINRISKKYVSYVGNPKLMNNIMAEIKIDLPCLKEQQKISDILSLLDEKIDTDKETLEHLKQLKKGLLQQMFA